MIEMQRIGLKTTSMRCLRENLADRREGVEDHLQSATEESFYAKVVVELYAWTCGVPCDRAEKFESEYGRNATGP